MLLCFNLFKPDFIHIMGLLKCKLNQNLMSTKKIFVKKKFRSAGSFDNICTVVVLEMNFHFIKKNREAL
jgi:hypothetical protein